MKRIVAPLLALLLTASLAHSQSRSTGLDFDEERFKQIPELPDANQGNKSIGNVPTAWDLSLYAPPVIDQGTIESCVAWSTAYYAFAIQYAASNKLNTTGQARTLALSAMLPFKQLRPGCEKGLNLHEAAQYIRDYGNLSYADFMGGGCQQTPTADLINRARQNQPIKEFARLFDSSNSDAEKIYRTKQQIGLFKTPVIVGIRTTERLRRLNASDAFYQPGGNPMGMHAVTVVGYDLMGFKILNSWGTSWGRNGYFTVRFADFARIAIGGLTLVLTDAYVPSPVITGQVGNRPADVAGEFAFQYLEADGTFRQLAPQHISNGVYELNRKNWEIGQMFQMVTNSPKAAQYMCVFSIDEDNKLEVHWPRNEQLAEFNQELFGLSTSPIIPRANFDQVIPAKDKALTITKTGTDYLCVIYSEKPILADLPAMLRRIHDTPGGISTRLRAGLGNRLMPLSNIRYQPHQMIATGASTAGDIIPLVLKIDSK